MQQVSAGYRSGQLTAVFVEPGFKKLWNCKCDCGGTVQVIESKLRLGQRRTCHTKRGPQDHSRKEFEFLKPLKFLRTDGRESIWLFRCVCGTEFEKRYCYVARGFTRSCGCKTKELKGRARRLPEERSVKNNAFCHHLANAEKRGIVSYLTQTQYISLAEQRCRYCGEISTRKHHLSRKEIPCNSVDRLNNEPYYKLENSVPCCFDCQTSKMDSTEDEFLRRVAKIYHTRKLDELFPEIT